MILKSSIPRSWRININGKPLISNHIVFGLGDFPREIMLSSGKVSVVKIKLLKSELVILRNLSTKYDFIFSGQLSIMVLVEETLCGAGSL